MDKIKIYYKNPEARLKIGEFLKYNLKPNTVIVCVGTDKCIGDCLGPMVGTFLREISFPLPVYGTIEEPIHALNLNKKVLEIKNKHANSHLLGIDACLGNKESIGEIQARNSPIHPGKGVGKVLPDVGDTSIIGIIDCSDNSELFTNRNIRLSLVRGMAKTITDSIIYAYNEIKNNYNNNKEVP